MPTEVTFSPTGIVIIDAIPNGELQTALNLERILRDIPADVLVDREVRRLRCETATDFTEGLQSIATECEQHDLRPIIHLEGHGTQNAFYFPDGSSIKWFAAFEGFRKINIACGNHLLVTSAACYSARSYTYDLAPFDRPAPVFGLIAPPDELTAGQAIDRFGVFYSTLFRSGSFAQAISDASEIEPKKPFSLMFCSFMFEQAAALYLRTQCMGRGRYARQEGLVSRALKERDMPPRITRKIIKEQLRRPQAPYLSRLHSIFMHVKKHPENRARFPFHAVEFERLVRSKGQQTVQLDVCAFAALQRIRKLT
jgi:hypothetical protein